MPSASDEELVGGSAYRLVLRPPDASWMGAVTDEIESWLREKGADLDLSRDVRTVVDQRSIRAIHHQQADAIGFHFSMEERNSGGAFVTTVLAVDSPSDPWLMVRVASDRKRMVPSPRVARRLLERMDLYDGGHRLSPDPRLVYPGDFEALRSRLEDASRRGVVLVMGTGSQITPSVVVPKLADWTRGCIGLSETVVMSPEATQRLRQTHPPFAVPEGGIRTFAPGVDIEDPLDSRTHRILSPATLLREPEGRIRALMTVFARAPLRSQSLPHTLARWERTFERLQNHELAGRIRVARPPRTHSGAPQETVELERIRTTLGVEDLSTQSLLSLVEAATAPTVDESALAEIDFKLRSLQEEKEELEDQLSESRESEWEARQDALDASDRATYVEHQLVTLQRRVSVAGVDVWSEAGGDPGGPSIPDIPGSWSDLADRGSEWSRVGVHITADVERMLDLEAMDIDGRALQACYQALTALSGYVDARRKGVHEQDFGGYLEVQPSGFPTYPPKKYAPTETGYTKQHYGYERIFPVPFWCSESGKETMLAHIKLTRIRNRDPRVYFMDATDEDDRCCVVVGYIGEHLTNRASARLN